MAICAGRAPQRKAACRTLDSPDGRRRPETFSTGSGNFHHFDFPGGCHLLMSLENSHGYRFARIYYQE
jgi:hypothetical protein